MAGDLPMVTLDGGSPEALEALAWAGDLVCAHANRDDDSAMLTTVLNEAIGLLADTDGDLVCRRIALRFATLARVANEAINATPTLIDHVLDTPPDRRQAVALSIDEDNVRQAVIQALRRVGDEGGSVL